MNDEVVSCNEIKIHSRLIIEDSRNKKLNKEPKVQVSDLAPLKLCKGEHNKVE